MAAPWAEVTLWHSQLEEKEMTRLGRPDLLRQALKKDGALFVAGSGDARDHVARKSGGPHALKVPRLTA